MASDDPSPQPDAPTWWLEDGEALHAAHPRSFFIPSREDREDVRLGEFCRLSVAFAPRRVGGEQCSSEALWVQVVELLPDGYCGRFDDPPSLVPDLQQGDTVDFEPRHVIGLVYSPEELGYDPGDWAMIDSRIIEHDEAPLALTFAEPEDMDERHWFAALDQQPPTDSHWVQLGELVDRWPELATVFAAYGGMWRRVASTGAYTQV